jgi:hypothetical protein
MLVHRFEHLKETFKRLLLNISFLLVQFLEKHQRASLTFHLWLVGYLEGEHWKAKKEDEANG